MVYFGCYLPSHSSNFPNPTSHWPLSISQASSIRSNCELVWSNFLPRFPSGKCHWSSLTFWANPKVCRLLVLSSVPFPSYPVGFDTQNKSKPPWVCPFSTGGCEHTFHSISFSGDSEGNNVCHLVYNSSECSSGVLLARTVLSANIFTFHPIWIPYTYTHIPLVTISYKTWLWLIFKKQTLIHFLKPYSWVLLNIWKCLIKLALQSQCC